MKVGVATAAGLSGMLLLGGCVAVPYGPTVPVMPSHGKSWSQFQREDAECQDYADSRVAGRAREANNRAVTTAIIGTALGAGLGAAIGGGNGAAIGAAGGALVGTDIAAHDARFSQSTLQGRYNLAYAQCMESHGNHIPGADEEEGPPPGYGDRYDRDEPPPPPRY